MAQKLLTSAAYPSAMCSSTIKHSSEFNKKPCACGCGSMLPLTDKRGRPHYYIRHHYTRLERSNWWKGGRYVHANGYIHVLQRGHPRATNSHPYVFEHILVMEKHIGRYILPSEHVHHINEDRTDNRIENLELLTKGEHSRLHRLKEIAEGKKLFGGHYRRYSQ